MTAAIAIPATTTPAAAALQGGAAGASSNATSKDNGFAAALAALIGGTTQPHAGPHAPKTHGATVPNAQASDAQDPSTIVVPVVPGLVVPVPQPQQALTADAAAQVNAQATQASALQILQAAQAAATPSAEQNAGGAKKTATAPTAPGVTIPTAPAAPAVTAPATSFSALVANAQQWQSPTPDTKGTTKATAAKDVAGVQKTQPNGAGDAATAPTEAKTPANGNLATAIQHALSGNANGNAQNGNAQTGAAHADAANLPAAASPVAIAIHTTTIDATSSQAPATEARAPVPLDALAVNIARKFESGESRFEIRLAPAELGKLDISMTVTHDGSVQAVVRAERPETLDLLQRDARVLENQLRQSGLNLDSGSLSFSLGGGNNRGAAFADAQQTFRGGSDTTATPTETVTTNSTVVTVRDGLDIRI